METPSKHINVDLQRWSTSFRRWYLVENESWVDAHLSTHIGKTTLKQRRQNYVDSRFNVDKITLFQRWNLVENESWTEVMFVEVGSTLKQHLKNYRDSTSINQCCLNFVIFDWEWKLSLFIGVPSTLRTQP